jgi:SOS-response transcriptional repressor LexA
MDKENTEVDHSRRRDEVLAVLVERITRTGSCPSYGEIGRALVPNVGKSRVQQLVAQLIRRGDIVREPGSRRGIQLRDVDSCREIIAQALQDRGWVKADDLIEPGRPYTFEQLPYLPLIVKDRPVQ